MARFEYPYKKGINVTAWVIQFIVCIILLAAASYLRLVGILQSCLRCFNCNHPPQRRYQHCRDHPNRHESHASGAVSDGRVSQICHLGRYLPPKSVRRGNSLRGIDSIPIVRADVLVWDYSMECKPREYTKIRYTDTIISGTSFMQLIYGAILVHRQRKGTLMVGFYTPPDHSVGLPEGPVYGGAEPQDRYFRPSTAASSEYKSPLSSPSVASPQFGFAPAAYAPPGSYELDGRARHF